MGAPELIAALPTLINLVNLAVKAIEDSQAHTAEEKERMIAEATAAVHASFARVAAVRFRDVPVPEPKPTAPG
jgi:hypothetical protein